MILQSTDYTPGQAGWTFNGTAATFAGEGHGDAHWETEPRALTVTGTFNCRWNRVYKGKARVLVQAFNAEGRIVASEETPWSYAGDFSIGIPAVASAVKCRVTVVASPARTAFYNTVYAAGVVNVQVE